jgi:hypothetical protein
LFLSCKCIFRVKNLVVSKNITTFAKDYVLLMTKRVLGLALLAAFLLMPVSTRASLPEFVSMEQADERNDVQITVSKSVIRVTGAEGLVMEVISLTGRHVMSVRIESPAQRIELTNIPKGCYIIKVGKVVRKIVI